MRSSNQGLAVLRMDSQQIEAGQVDQALDWLARLPSLPSSELPALADIEATSAALLQPVDPAWCMARIASLLSPYYDKATPDLARVMEAQDWMEALADYPQWAIDRAVRWWKSAENEARRKRPLEGDIAARCVVEMRGIRAASALARRKVEGRYIEAQPDSATAPVSAAAAQEILARAGFGVRRMDGGAA